MGAVIEDYLRLTVKDCKRMGYFAAKASTTGILRWTQGTEVIASVLFETNLTGAVPFAVLSYRYRGEQVTTNLTLRFKQSNLKAETGFYYFVCPVTGLSCRNLYLVEGKFVSRTAFRPLYRKQAETHVRKSNGSWAVLRACTDYEQMLDAKYRRLTYRGKLTPYGRKVMKAGAKYKAIMGETMERVERKGWGSV